jgi:hypothetical protein
LPVYSRAGPWRIVASVVLSSLMAVPAGAITRELPYGPLFTGPATRPIDGEDSNWPPTVTANHDKYTGHHTFAEYTADRKRRVQAGVAIAADSGRKPMRKVE